MTWRTAVAIEHPKFLLEDVYTQPDAFFGMIDINGIPWIWPMTELVSTLSPVRSWTGQKMFTSTKFEFLIAALALQQHHATTPT